MFILTKNIEKVFLQCRIIAWVCQVKVYNTSMNSKDNMRMSNNFL
jgi:hypothetical protein